ncbi:MAG: DJ-1/PfpI family protein [Bacteroidaceae bacterium]|nr:DJ-1/PfpI family protein [Bacteroidaceae bacterium]
MVHLFLANGFEEIEALATLDILRRANIEVSTISISGARVVQGAHGISVKADNIYRKGQIEMSDCIILPGGMPGADNLRMHEGLRRTLKVQAKRGGFIAAICASPAVVLGTCGILQDRRATTYPGTAQIEHGAQYQIDGIVVDDNIITAKAPGFTFEFAFKIVEALKGIDAVRKVKEGMCLV